MQTVSSVKVGNRVAHTSEHLHKILDRLTGDTKKIRDKSEREQIINKKLD